MPEVKVQITDDQDATLSYLANESGDTRTEIVKKIFGSVLRKSLQNAFEAEKSVIQDINEKGLTGDEQTELLSKMAIAKSDYLTSIGKS